ncbi:uncharacterized protein LOC117122090 [Anneissia japonica]|uniref:uncharacterized protein LOC117122090 n=1 Tax=Anneissia japonica TaxID=1529436 RepID=UPI00142570D5|nr:uncharacterized protein LOC117122090 [Anneissia japonica]
MRHPDSNKSDAERRDLKDDSLKLTFRTSRRRRSSLQVVPEHGFLSAVSNVKFVLPDWCSMDATRVTIEIINKIAMLIGNKVASVGILLGLRQGEIETIEHDHKYDLQRQNYEVLHLWVQRQGILATKKRLALVLVEIGRAEETFQYLWPERELEPVTPTTPTDYFWKRRKSDSSNFNFDTTVLRKKDWTKDSTWRIITQNLRESDSGKFDELIGACHVLRSKLPKFGVLEKCQSASGNSDLEIDHYANSLTDSDRQGLTAIKVSADDNCLFSAASIVAFGSANRCCELRLCTVIELCCEKDYYLKQEALIKCMKAEYELTKTEDDDILSDDAIPAVFEGCVRDTLKELFSLHGNPIQMFGLASVL